MNSITPERTLKGLEDIIDRQREQIEHQKREIDKLKKELQVYKDYHKCATSVISDLQDRE